MSSQEQIEIDLRIIRGALESFKGTTDYVLILEQKRGEETPIVVSTTLRRQAIVASAWAVLNSPSTTTRVAPDPEDRKA